MALFFRVPFLTCFFFSIFYGVMKLALFSVFKTFFSFIRLMKTYASLHAKFLMTQFRDIYKDAIQILFTPHNACITLRFPPIYQVLFKLRHGGCFYSKTIAFLTGHLVARYIRSLAPLTPLTHSAVLCLAPLARSVHRFSHSLRSQPNGTVEFMNICSHCKRVQ